MDTPDSDAKVAAQYVEVGDFLGQLAARLVDSDRSRVIIVPGNHDVHWVRARQAMRGLYTCPDGIAGRAFDAGSNVRWDWGEQLAYEIVDRIVYESRFEHFRQFQTDFYGGLEPNPLSQGKDLVFSEYPSLGLLFVGFASWYGNDCFCHVGEIDSASLALSQKLLEESRVPVAIAVWHHSIVGGSRAHDYIDQRVIHRLIDFGFSVGLHGHQHYPGAAPFELRLPNLTSMAVVAGGSLAVGDSELPMGERRQFNVVVIDSESQLITVHVRAMSHAGVFTGSHRDDFGGNTFVKLSLPSSPSRPRRTTVTQTLDDAMTAVAVGQNEKALELVADIDVSHSREKRLVEIKALDALGRQEELIGRLDPPQNVDEIVKFISLLLDAGRYDEASGRLEGMSGLIDHATLKELTAVIAARRVIS